MWIIITSRSLQPGSNHDNLCNDTGLESDGIYQTTVSFNEIVFDYLGMFHNIYSDKVIEDLLDNPLDFILIYDLLH